MIRDDLDSLFSQDFHIRPARLIFALLLWSLLIGGGCALIFRWTTTPPGEQPYSLPLRTRPPSPTT